MSEKLAVPNLPPMLATESLPYGENPAPSDLDKEFLQISQAFGNDYVGLLSGEGTGTDLQSQLSAQLTAQMEPLLSSVEGLQGSALAKQMVTGYRTACDKFFARHGYEPKFGLEEVDSEALSHVLEVTKGPFGIPIIYTDGENEALFDDDTLSFASSELMIENDMPPLVVIYGKYSAVEHRKVTAHETSHAVFALLRRSGAIIHPDGEGLTAAGQKTSFELARDEAVAQMAANQNTAIHPNVTAKMKKEGLDKAALDEYRGACQAFTRHTAEAAGLKFSDAILGVLQSKNFTELNSHLVRMHELATAV